jgi:hypothetical protein
MRAVAEVPSRMGWCVWLRSTERGVGGGVRGEHLAAGCFSPVDRILGLLADLRGDLDEAVIRLETAVAL